MPGSRVGLTTGANPSAGQSMEKRMNNAQVKKELVDAAAGGVGDFLRSTRGARLRADVLRPKPNVLQIRCDDTTPSRYFEITIKERQ